MGFQKLKSYLTFQQNTPLRPKLILVAVLLSVFALCLVRVVAGLDVLLLDKCRHHPWLVLLHLLLMVLVFCGFVAGWIASLWGCGQRLPLGDAASCWLAANAGKYLPGKVFMLAGRALLCVRMGVRRSVCFSVIVLEHLMMLLATLPFLIPLVAHGYQPDRLLLCGAGVIGLTGAVLLLRPQLLVLSVNKVLQALKREHLAVVPAPAAMPALLAIYALQWLAYGISGLVLARILEINGALSPLLLVSAFVVSWLIGFLSLVTPGGIGVREAVLVLLLKPAVATADALALALLARATWTVVEITGIGVGLWLGRKWLGEKNGER